MRGLAGWLAGGLIGALLLPMVAPGDASAQEPKRGGILRMHHRDSPANASVHEASTISVVIPFMSMFNNLVRFNQHAERNTAETIEPELATSWTWDATNTRLTFKLREGVKWHDGQPFTAKDVVCTFDLLRGTATDRFRSNPRKGWYGNVKDVKANGDHEVAFTLERPQPSMLSMLAAGYTPMYPCHVNAATMRTKPIGTGPFKFVEFKANETIRLARNENYWVPGRPYLDGIEYSIITNRSTAMLAFVAGKLDMTFPYEMTAGLTRDIKQQAPASICTYGPTNVSINLIVNRERAPFDNADIRRAMALTLDRKSFVQILFEGDADIGGAMLPAPAGVWGMPREIMETIPGYNPDVAKNRAEARAIMEKLGYGPNNRLALKVSTRNIPQYRDPAVILIDHLKEIYIDGELEPIDTAQWVPKIVRKDYSVGLNLTGSSLDDPDQNFFENYACGSERNFSLYCNRDLEKLFVQQSGETDLDKRRKVVWEIDRQLQTDVARPIIAHTKGGTCWHPDVRGWTPALNSIYNSFRFEDLALNR
jgi:peptide/nickel transport system substrate-binding protein